jgi:hypothetical protein
MKESVSWPQMRQMLVPEKTPELQIKDLVQLGVILLITLIYGLIYVFLVPPWQHYDEPNHFEYVWLVAHRDRLPDANDRHPRFSWKVIRSMVENGFYDRIGGAPELGSDFPANLKIPGHSQLGEPPLYYLYVALPLRFLPPISIERQLYVARLMSLSLLLITVIAAWGTARSLAPPGHPLRWLLPAMMALLPGFVDLMTAVNNDAAAIASFSLFVWGSLRLLRNGLSLLNFLWTVAAAGLTYYTKNTAMIAIVALPLVLLLAVFRRRLRWIAWLTLGVSLLTGLAFSLSVDDAQGWYRGHAWKQVASQTAGFRQQSADAPLGTHALMIEMPLQVPARQKQTVVFQVLPPTIAHKVYDHEVTLGFWAWGSQPMTVISPIFKTARQEFSIPITVTTRPQFFAVQIRTPSGSDRLWVDFNIETVQSNGGQNPPTPSSEGQTDAAEVGTAQLFYDGLVLALGSRPVDSAPLFYAEDASAGVWGDQPFENLLRNASFETPALRVNSRLDDLATQVMPDNARPSLMLASLADPAGSAYYFRIVAQHLFQTFWARFGWGHVPLIWEWVYGVLAGICGLCLLGCLIGGWRMRRRLPGDVIALVALSMGLAWGLSLARGAVYLNYPFYYFPTARHAYPAIIPTMLFLSGGWLGLTGGWKIGRILILAFLAGLGVLSIFSIAVFYGKI